MRPILQLLSGFVGIAGLLTLLALAFYVTWRLALFIASFLPIIGRRHKHAEWEQLQKFRNGRKTL